MEQNKLESLEETIVNTFVGFLASGAFQVYLVPLITGRKSTMTENVFIIGGFTILSIIRGYAVRRVYNKHKGIFVRFFKRIFKK